MTAPDPQFDRLRPRSAQAQRPAEHRPKDRSGKRALYSETAAPPGVGAVALTCSKCRRRSVVTWAQAARAALPGVLLPVPGAGLRAWLRCPACQQRGWVHVNWRT